MKAMEIVSILLIIFDFVYGVTLTAYIIIDDYRERKREKEIKEHELHRM